MNLLKYSREEIVRRVEEGEMAKQNIRHYDVCKAMAQGMSYFAVAEAFDLTDDSHARKIRSKKCPDCKKIS